MMKNIQLVLQYKDFKYTTCDFSCVSEADDHVCLHSVAAADVSQQWEVSRAIGAAWKRPQ